MILNALAPDVAQPKAESLLAAAAVEDAFALHGDSHERMGHGRHRVGHVPPDELQRVQQAPGLRVVNLQVQVRPGGMSRIAADGNQVARLDGEALCGKAQVKRVAVVQVQCLLILVGKAPQMAVDAGVSVGVADVDGIAKAILVGRDPRDIAVGYGADGLSLHVVGLDVQSAVEVPGAGLAKVSRQRNVVGYRTLVGDSR